MINSRSKTNRRYSRLNGANRGAYAFVSLMSIICLVLFTGCSGGEKITKAGGILKVNGKPVTGTTATIEFYPVEGGRTANAVVQDDGTFTISYRKPGDGLPPGKYKVAVIADIFVERPSAKARPEGEGEDGGFTASPGRLKHVVPTIYNSIERTPLVSEIPDDGKVQFVEIDIEVKKK